MRLLPLNHLHCYSYELILERCEINKVTAVLSQTGSPFGSPPPHEAATVSRVHGDGAPWSASHTTVCTGVPHCAGEPALSDDEVDRLEISLWSSSTFF